MALFPCHYTFSWRKAIKNNNQSSFLLGLSSQNFRIFPKIRMVTVLNEFSTFRFRATVSRNTAKDAGEEEGGQSHTGTATFQPFCSHEHKFELSGVQTS